MAGKKRPENPRIMLVGSFPDLFLEGLQELEFDFFLHKNEMDMKGADILVIAEDRIENATDYVKESKAVPVIKKGVRNFVAFDPLSETGNSFIYEENNPWHMLRSLIRAVETYEFEYDWKVVRNQVKEMILENTPVPA